MMRVQFAGEGVRVTRRARSLLPLLKKLQSLEYMSTASKSFWLLAVQRCGRAPLTLFFSI